MVENERIRRKKQGAHSLNPNLSNNATSNTSINYKQLQTSDSNGIEHTLNQGNFILLNLKLSYIIGPIFETSTTTNSRIMQINSSRSSFLSPRQEGSKFPMAERKFIMPGNQNSKLGPGSYFQENNSKNLKFTRTAKNESTFKTDGTTIGKSPLLRNQTENIKKRK